MEVSSAKLNQQNIPNVQQNDKQEKFHELWKTKMQEIEQSREFFTKLVKEAKEERTMSEIMAKLRSGRRLSPAELRYLSQKDPMLYQKAVQIMEEQKSYERSLKRCKTKAEAQRLLTTKMSTLNAIAKVFPEEAEIRMSGIQSIHHKFTQSKEYASLPADEREAHQRKKTKGKQGALDDEDAQRHRARFSAQV